MSPEAAQLPKDVATLPAIVAEQSSTIASLTQKLVKLEHYVEQLVRARYGPRSEQADSSQLTLFDMAAAEEPKSSPCVVREIARASRRRPAGAARAPGTPVRGARPGGGTARVSRLRPRALADWLRGERATGIRAGGAVRAGPAGTLVEINESPILEFTDAIHNKPPKCRAMHASRWRNGAIAGQTR